MAKMEEFIEQTKAARLEREKEKKMNQSAIIIQVCYGFTIDGLMFICLPIRNMSEDF